MNLSECTDQEINMQMAKIIYPDHQAIEREEDEGVFFPGMGPFEPTSFDWVNDRNLWAGLMEDNKITPVYSNGLKKWAGSHHSLGLHIEARFVDGLGRAVVETFIKMKQEGIS